MSDHEVIQMIREALGGDDPCLPAWADVLAYDQTELVIDTRLGGRVEVQIGTRPITAFYMRQPFAA